MVRAAPGLRRISPARSRVSTIWWTEGGVTPKCRCKAPSRCCWRARRSHTRRLCQPDRPNFARPGAAQYRKATCHQSNRRYGKPCTPRSRREQPGARAALNAGNEPALLATLHFPHYRLAGGRMRVWDQSGAYLGDFLARAGADWHHSEWDFRQVAAAGAAKVHLDVQFTRYRADNSVIGSFRSLWIVTEDGGRWAVAARSSFAD